MIVRADHHGLRVEIASQPDERVRYRHIIGYCQAVSLPTGFPGQRSAMLCQPLRVIVGCSFRLEGGADVKGGRRQLQRLLGKRPYLEIPSGLPDDYDECRPRG